MVGWERKDSVVEAVREVSIDLLHSLLRGLETRIVDGIVGASFIHPAFGYLTITSWSPQTRPRSMRLSVTGSVGEKLLCSDWMLENGIYTLRLADKPVANTLYDACNAAIEAEVRREEERRQKERQKEEERQRREERQREELRLQEQRWREEWIRKEAERKRIERLEQQHRERYANSVRDIAEAYRAQVTSRLPRALPSTYEITDTSFAVLARNWFGAALVDRPSSLESQPELDPFLEITIEWWDSRDLWTQMRLIRHFTDHGFHKDALGLSFELETCASETRLIRAIRVSRFRTLSIAGFGTEAETLGRALHDEQGRLDKYLSFALWGHYGRWPSLDPDERLRSWLKDYFRDIGESPSRKDDHQIDELDYYSLEAMRGMLGDDSDIDDVPF